MFIIITSSAGFARLARRATLERPELRRTDPLLLIYSFQFRSAFRATTTPSQPQIRRPQKAPTSVVTDNLVKLIVV